VGDGILFIETLHFEGEGNLSQSGRYLVGWSQPKRDARGLLHGMWVLLDHASRRLIEFGGMGHPGPCFVGDDGTVLIVNEAKKGDAEDQLLAVEGRSELWVVRQSARRPVRLAAFPVEALDCGLSADGLFAFFWLSDHRPGRNEPLEEGELVILDTRELATVGRFLPGCGVPARCELDSVARVISLVFTGHTLRYSFDGTLLNEDVLRQAEEAKAAADPYGYQLIDRASEVLASASPEDSESRKRAVELFRQGLEKKVSDHTRAVVHRTLGELLMSESRKPEALVEFQAALKWDPKIGLKRMEAQLRRELGM
jgi:hypothetical protein